MTTSAPIRAGELELWAERRGDGSDALLIAGPGDPAEARQPQFDGLALINPPLVLPSRVVALDARAVARRTPASAPADPACRTAA